MFLAIAMALPVSFSLYYGDGDHMALLGSAAITLLSGLLLFKATRFERDLRPKEGFAVVTFAWVSLSLFGCLPFLLSGAIPSFTDAFFETMSGFTTTGATILTDVERLPHGLLFWRSFTHWIGGMGIIVLSLAILPFLGIGGMQLFKAEVPGPVADKLTPRIAGTAKILWGVYVLISAVEALLLWLGGMSVFDALCHTFGTVATGGFSTRNASIGAYDSAYIDYVIIVFMLLAGTSFALHYRLLRGDIRAYVRSREFLFFLSIIGIALVIIIGLDTFLLYHRNVGLTIRKTLFQVVAILTTTGYGTADYGKWAFSSQFVLFILMFIGGCAGSTGGGMKVMRIHLLVKVVFTEFTHLLHPHAVRPVRIGQNVIPRDVVSNVVGFFITFLLIFVLGVLVMSALGLDMATSFGAVAAAINNIGPGLGDVGPSDNYSHIPAAGKWILAFLMLVGRLEVFTVIILFSPSYWRK
jgi:trk system potassium uptake protein TrkH